MKRLIVLTITFTLLVVLVFCLTEKKETSFRHQSAGSSPFLLGNLLPGEPPCHIQLDNEYNRSKKDVIVVEALTMAFYEPLISCPISKESYSGISRANDIRPGCKRFLAKTLFSVIEATPFSQQFYEQDKNKIQNRSQVYLQLILGYRIDFLKKRLFIEPALAIKYWPAKNNCPSSFSATENGAPVCKCEHALNFGFSFRMERV